jgi:hypothetical protein
MSLSISAVTPEGIVVAADSAMTTVINGEEAVFTGFPKVVIRRAPGQAFAMIGDLRIGTPGADSWAHLWLRQFLADLAPQTNLADTAQELASDLNKVASPTGGISALVGAAWERVGRVGDAADTGIYAPTVWEVSRNTPGGEFLARELLTEEDQRVMAQMPDKGDAGGDKLFEVRLFHAGIPEGYGAWIIGDGRKQFSEFTGEQLPGTTIVAVEEYVRFAIRLAADLYAVAGMHRYVAEPIHSAVLFPPHARPTVYRTTR